MENLSPVKSIVPNLLILLRDINWVKTASSPEFVCGANAFVFLLLISNAMWLAMGLYEDFGLTLNIIRKMFLEGKHYFQVLLMLIVIFSLSFFNLYSGSGVSDFSTIPEAFTTLFFFVFNLDQSVIMQDQVPLRRATALLLMSVYMVLVALTVVNLIIAVFSNSYEQTKRLAKAHTVLLRAAYVLMYEEYSARASLFRIVLARLGLKGSSCSRELCNVAMWRKWEKASTAIRSRNVVVREFHDGRVEIRTTQAILKFVRKAVMPPLFHRFAALYETTSQAFFPMPLLDHFSWTQVNMDEPSAGMDQEAKESLVLTGNYSSSTNNYGSMLNKDRELDPFISAEEQDVDGMVGHSRPTASASVSSTSSAAWKITSDTLSSTDSDVDGPILVGYFMKDPQRIPTGNDEY
jgi:hypothetical protein